MPDTGNVKDYLELPPNTFLIFTLKNVTWQTYLISFTVQYCFLFRFVCIELVSLIKFKLQSMFMVMTNRSTLIKKLMQTYIVKVSGRILNISTVHLHGIWHLIWRYLSKPVLGGHPVLSGRYSIPEGIRLIQVSLYLQADDMTVYNDELENRKLIGYCRKEKRKTGPVFLLISFIRIMFNISFKS